MDNFGESGATGAQIGFNTAQSDPTIWEQLKDYGKDVLTGIISNRQITIGTGGTGQPYIKPQTTRQGPDMEKIFMIVFALVLIYLILR